MRSKRIAIRRRRRRRAPSRRTNAPSALPRCSRHCSPILLRAAAATAHRRGAPKTMMMIHASLSHKIDFGFFSCVWNSLSLTRVVNFLGATTHTKKRKKTETIPVRGHQNQIITYSKKSRLNVILFLSKNKSLPWWVGI